MLAPLVTAVVVTEAVLFVVIFPEGAWLVMNWDIPENDYVLLGKN